MKLDNQSFTVGLMRHPPVNVVTGLCYGHMDVPLQKNWDAYVFLPDSFKASKIYSSPLSRCLQLAQKISKQYNLPYVTDTRLLEFHFGEWEGKIWDDLPRQSIDQWAEDPWGWQVPGGETGQNLFDRVMEIWQEIKQQQENILIVSHAGPLRLLRQIIMEQQPIELLGDLPDFGKLETFHVAYQ